MIKITIPDSTLKNHWQYFQNARLARLDRAITETSGDEHDFFTFLREEVRLQNLVIGEVHRLREIINDIESQFNGLFHPCIPEKFKRKIEHIFDYDSFTRGNADWGAYKLTQSLGVLTCPYCNRQYTLTFYSLDGKTRPELDHFFPQYKFPYLSLSIFNLIPACHVCNSNLKGTEDFYETEHMHPYEEGFEDNARFKVNLKPGEDGKYMLDYLFGAGSENDFELELSINNNYDSIEKISNNIRTFKLQELYQFHKDHVYELIKKTIFYNESRIFELAKKEPYQRIFKDESEIIRVLIGNYVEHKNLSKRILSKLTKDIWEEFRFDDVWKTKPPEQN